MSVPDTGLLTAGETSAHLILEPRGWINRRVETIELLSHEETRRHVSVDFTLDEQTRDGLTTRHGVVVPISVLSKAPLRHFDLRDEGGRAVPAVGRADNSELAYVAALSTALAPQTGKVDPSAFRRVASSVRTVVSGTPDVALHELGSMARRGVESEPLYDALWADADARKLLELLALNYVLFAVLPTGDCAPRRVLKFSYGDDLDLTISRRPKTDVSFATLASRAWRPDRRAFQIECAAADRGASFHAEIAIPEELRVERAEMADRHRDVVIGAPDENVNRVSLYAGDLDEDSDVVIEIVVAPERAGAATQAALTGAAVASLLSLGWASGLDAENPGSAISILLAGAAIFSGVTAGQGEHVLVRAMFGARRRWLGLSTVCALAGSASLAMELPSATPLSVWLVASAFAWCAALRLTWSAVRARP